MCESVANSFAAVYSQLVDEFRDRIPLHLSGDAVLDWFGHVVSGRENIAHHMLLEVPSTTHSFTSVKYSASTRRHEAALPARCEGDQSSLSLDLSALSIASDDHKSVLSTPMETAPSFESGRAPMKFANLHLTEHSDVLVMEAVGKLQFECIKTLNCAPQDNMKAFKDAQRWERACRLHVFYSVIDPSVAEQAAEQTEFKHFRIHKMVYRESAKCRRNLALEFEQVAQQT